VCAAEPIQSDNCQNESHRHFGSSNFDSVVVKASSARLRRHDSPARSLLTRHRPPVFVSATLEPRLATDERDT